MIKRHSSRSFSLTRNPHLSSSLRHDTKRETAFTIKVKLGNKIAQVSVDPSRNLSSFALSYVLKFTAEQRLFLKITGLKLIRTASAIPPGDHHEVIIAMNDDLEVNGSGPTIMSLKDMKRLEKDCVYELCIADKRAEYANQLTEEELDEIKSHFNSMDLDQNGVLTTDEIVEYFKKETDRNITSCWKVTERKIQNDPMRKDKYMSDFNARQSFYKSTLEQRVKFFFQIDSDANGAVSWQEFLAHAARTKIRERNQDNNNTPHNIENIGST